MGFALVYGSVGALALIAFAWRLALALRGGPQATARWAVAIAIACAAIGFEAAVPQTYSWIGRVSGVPNLATLIVYAAIATAVLWQLVWTGYLVAPEGAAAGRSRIARVVLLVNVAVVGDMTILFGLAPVHDASHPTDFDYTYATVPLVDVFLGIYLCAYTVGLVRIVVLCRTWLPQVREQPWLRRGLVLLAAGSLISLGYSVGKVAAIVAAWAGVSAYELNTKIAPGFASAGATIMLVGYLCPSLLPKGVSAVRHARALPQLHPLWSALRAATPELADAAPAVRGSVQDRLYRRVIEIRDALLILQPHLSPEITARAARAADDLRISGADRAAAVEAGRIALALRAHRDGVPPVDRGETFQRPGEPSFPGELAWLVAVATAYRDSPVVAAVLAEPSDSMPAHD
ncbi:MAB_1171c family putative transporter [Nocardia sp. NPDC020380]|uniref:MAB_1171c family putative transporter n=1 Tax=Nocardia sp. NPDC020380 TaxID=3364309 RepID=UPI0037A971EF